MITLLIWSKNRALQLEALLHSINEYTDNPFDTVIIYKADGKHVESYSILEEQYPEVRFVNEQDFFLDTCTEILQNKNKFICFSTDDTIFYRKVPKITAYQEYLPKYLSEVFSYRLGFNTIVQDCHKNTKQPPLNHYITSKHLIHWDTSRYHPLNNYGYPMSLDMHVFNSDLMKQVVDKVKFNNTNSLETELVLNYSNTCRYISSFKKSVAFNNPINNMSNITISGKYYSYDIEFLNEQFLNDKRIDITSLDEDIIGCHQEVKIKVI